MHMTLSPDVVRLVLGAVILVSLMVCHRSSYELRQSNYLSNRKSGNTMTAAQSICFLWHLSMFLLAAFLTAKCAFQIGLMDASARDPRQLGFVYILAAFIFCIAAAIAGLEKSKSERRSRRQSSAMPEYDAEIVPRGIACR